jgi:hypothetical protein
VLDFRQLLLLSIKAPKLLEKERVDREGGGRKKKEKERVDREGGKDLKRNFSEQQQF